MLEPLQLAYWENHCTETALLKVKTEIMTAMDNQEVMCLMLLDLSPAFDTVSHDPLLNRLKMRFGIDGNVLSWLQLYLRGRAYSVVVQETRSEDVLLTQGVPQGTYPGPSIAHVIHISIG